SGLISSGGKSSGGKYSFLGLTGDRLAQWAFASFVVFGMIAAVARYFGERMMVGMAGDAERRTRNEAANRVLSLEWEEMTLERSGALQKSVVDNPFHINLGVMAILGGLGQAGAGMMLALGAFVVAPAMTLAACVFGSLIGVFYQRFGRRTYSINQDLSKAATRLSSVTSEVFRAAKLFMLSGRRNEAFHFISTENTSVSSLRTRYSKLLPATRLVFDSAAVVFVAPVLYLAAFSSTANAVKFLVFLPIFYRIVPRLQAAQHYFLQAASELAWLEEHSLVIEAHTGVDIALPPARPTTPTTSIPGIVFRDVSYRYPGAERAVLEHFHLEVPGGECVALVGQSGGGKTTIMDLASGLLPPTGGSILVDGRPLEGAHRIEWQQRLGIVAQDVTLLFGTIAANVSFGEPNPDPQRVWRALDRANLREVIEGLPHGIDTPIGEMGAGLSGGQRQRLAFARALYGEPSLLILDEATSALDAESEEEVRRTLANLKGTCTVLIVAHRLKTIEMADTVVVLEHGAVVETGSIEALLKANGRFAQLAQASRVMGADDATALQL
ncbi:MAG: ABC transporter ATP-binding protein, partial [Acidimicrobiia bacterium]